MERLDQHQNIKLHEWIYNFIGEVCYDREYLYLSFIRGFTTLMNQIYDKGNILEGGSCVIPGIKSNLQAEIEWKLHHRVNFVGLNIITLNCSIKDTISGNIIEEAEKKFELSSGESIE